MCDRTCADFLPPDTWAFLVRVLPAVTFPPRRNSALVNRCHRRPSAILRRPRARASFGMWQNPFTKTSSRLPCGYNTARLVRSFRTQNRVFGWTFQMNQEPSWVTTGILERQPRARSVACRKQKLHPYPAQWLGGSPTIVNETWQHVRRFTTRMK